MSRWGVLVEPGPERVPDYFALGRAGAGAVVLEVLEDCNVEVVGGSADSVDPPVPWWCWWPPDPPPQRWCFSGNGFCGTGVVGGDSGPGGFWCNGFRGSGFSGNGFWGSGC